MSISSGLLMITSPLALYYSGNVSEKLLPMKLWLPTKLTNSNYWYYFCFVIMHFVWSPAFSSIYDTLFLSLNLHAALQFDIMFYRLRNITMNLQSSGRLSISSFVEKKRPKLFKERQLLSSINHHHHRILL